MLDIKKIGSPIEVYLAADGEPEALMARLRSDTELNSQEREALALLFEGKLQYPKRKKGERRPKYLYGALHEPFNSAINLPAADKTYKFLMEERKKGQEAYGNAEEVLEYVAEIYKLDLQKLSNYVRRSQKQKRSKVRSPCNEVERFHYWLYASGRLHFPND